MAGFEVSINGRIWVSTEGMFYSEHGDESVDALNDSVPTAAVAADALLLHASSPRSHGAAASSGRSRFQGTDPQYWRHQDPARSDAASGSPVQKFPEELDVVACGDSPERAWRSTRHGALVARLRMGCKDLVGE